MKKNWILITLSLIASAFFMSACQNVDRETILNEFADSMDNFDILLRGHIDYQENFVSFNLLPVVPKQVSDMELIGVRNKKGAFVIFQRIPLHNHIPAPYGKKEMTKWKVLFLGGFEDSGKDDAKGRRMVRQALKVFKKVVKNGQISYKKVADVDALRRYFQYHDGKSPEKAWEMAKKAYKNPEFSW